MKAYRGPQNRSALNALRMTTEVPLQLLSDSARAALTAYRNLLINASFQVNQRGYADVQAFGAGQYSRDRWRISTALQFINFSASEGQAVAPAGGMEQLIEASMVPAGAYALSWQGTATAQVNGVAVPNCGTVQIAGGATCSVKFLGGTVKEPQFEPGTVATAFERLPLPFQWLMCKRYYRRITASMQLPAIGSGVQGYQLEAPMRAMPAITVASAGTESGGAWEAPVALSADAGYFKFTASAAQGFGTGRVYTLDAELVS